MLREAAVPVEIVRLRKALILLQSAAAELVSTFPSVGVAADL